MLLRIIHFCFKQYFKTVIVKKAISYKSEFGEEKNQSNRILGRECKEMSVWCLFRKPSFSFLKKEIKYKCSTTWHGLRGHLYMCTDLSVHLTWQGVCFFSVRFQFRFVKVQILWEKLEKKSPNFIWLYFIGNLTWF